VIRSVGISTGIAYRHPIDDVLEPIRASGLELLEVSTAPQHVNLDHHGALEALARRICDHGLRVHSLHAPFGHDVNLTSPDPGQRAAAIDRLTRAADALRILGGRYYVIHPGGEDLRWVWEREARLDLSVEGLRRIHEVCASRGLVLTVETPLPHLLGGQLDDFGWILERLPVEGTGVCIDTSHCSLGGFLFEALERFGSRLVHVQASDNRGTFDDHLPPGDGIIDWGRFVATLDGLHYDGVLLLEVSGDGDIAAHVERAAAAARRVLGAARAGDNGPSS
jgi:sugar phosphate isomerase/epimerase